jgi:hypothetical protein
VALHVHEYHGFFIPLKETAMAIAIRIYSSGALK